ncbi:hypothetical protein [Sphingomonas dokdonensis]|uniref:Uncharacterized protein n=1 Tax=Sphingomonas dokdonensis TaxID=344880 RepID=A0A245ZNM1_9SPHN|nr:hypothetical protein [Sphingomonas dokdonensis]OWK31332.1 hypothetical protein SPDO_13400 [Sphingomonas dokdonensis]
MSVAVSGSGRPFRFLGSLIALWIGMRIVQLWPADGTLALAEALAPVAVLERDASARAAPQGEAPHDPALPAGEALARQPLPHASRRAARQPAGVMAAGAMLVPTMVDVPPPLAPSGQATAGEGVPLAVAAPIAAPGAPLSHGPVTARLRGSGWLIVRGGQAAPFVPQLGGSQAGARLTYLLLPEARLALAGRFSTALRSRQREAAIGLDWQPTRLPVHLVAEQRIGIDNARGGPALGVVAGLGPVPLAAGLTLDGYGQAGVIARDGTEGYADGAVRASRVVARAGAARIELGLGAWGAAQRGAARLDAGPSASAVVPLGSGAAVRLSLEWRARLAGNATPTSGPALSIGTDF